jgi:ubiquinone/menaquinone biosynthesis C-methylase UbiE
MCGKSKQELITFYSKTNLRQHEEGHELKAPDKIAKVLEITAIKKDDFILDIGCARRELVYRLTTRTRCGIGIDIARNILKRARKSEKIRYVQADAGYIPFDDNVFSKIICLDLLEHVLNPEKVLIEIKRPKRIYPWFGDILIKGMIATEQGEIT